MSTARDAIREGIEILAGECKREYEIDYFLDALSKHGFRVVRQRQATEGDVAWADDYTQLTPLVTAGSAVPVWVDVE